MKNHGPIDSNPDPIQHRDTFWPEWRESMVRWCEGVLDKSGDHTDKHAPESDPVNHPKHYTSHGSGIECIQLTEHMNFCLGNAIKYVWRADLKHDAIEDLKKAVWYIEREIARRGGA